MGKKLKVILSEIKARFADIYGERLVEMVLFGSQARGDAEAGSDIDLLVVLRDTVDPVGEIRRVSDTVADVSLQNDIVISCVFVDEGRYRRRNGPLLRNVRREGVRL